MRIVIEHKRVKRFIEGGYHICGSRADLLRLAKAILKTVGDNEGDFFYGWIEVTEPVEKVPDMKAKTWVEK